MIYTHVLFDTDRPVKSPLDLLREQAGSGEVGDWKAVYMAAPCVCRLIVKLKLN